MSHVLFLVKVSYHKQLWLVSLCTIFEEKPGLSIVLEANIVVGVATFVQGTVQGDLGPKEGTVV